MAGENKLSDKALKGYLGKPREKQITIADGKGLSIRVSTKGAVSFVFFYRLAGGRAAPVWLTLGKYPDMSLKQAREKRDECRGWLADKRDPRIQIKIQAEERLKPVTVEDALNYWYENYCKVRRKTHAVTLGRFRKHIFPYIGHLPVNDTHLYEWLDCFDRIKRNAPVMAAYVFSDTKLALRFCRVRQYATCDALKDLRMSDVGQIAGKRDRVLDEAELGQLWKAIFVEPDLKLMSEYTRKMFVLCTVFGCRMSEARLSEWSEWDLESWVWTVPKDHSKTGVEIVRPVPEILRQWVTDVHEETKHTGYVLGSLRIRESVSKIGGKIGKRLGHEKQWSLHDLRRMLSTHLSDLGVEFYVVEQLLGHALPGVAGVYNRSKFMAKKLDALELWTTYLNSIAGADSKVTILKQKVG
ncbi:TPA: integrase arm-type DNA-binding domain-containing protein [Escherichia coli]|uniref:tyrosine-type recombinase/integrase n=1 Tax=Escherichia coli TaxID=562 RepID=UPI000E20F434|nr:integrase arm-type DNA-binding domain-containing protein [Escherichia coli]